MRLANSPWPQVPRTNSWAFSLAVMSSVAAELRFSAGEEFTAGIPGRVDGSIAFSSSLTDLVQESDHHPPVVGAICSQKAGRHQFSDCVCGTVARQHVLGGQTA